MKPQKKANGIITVYVTLTTLAITFLFGILIARATYVAFVTHDSNAFLRVIVLNDLLDSLRSAVVNEVASWGSAI